MKPSYERELLETLKNIAAHLSEVSDHIFFISETMKANRNDKNNNGQSLRFGPAEPAFPAQEPTP